MLSHSFKGVGMRHSLAHLAVIAAFGVGCSSSAPSVSLVTDEGLLVRVVAIVRDSTGYSIQFQNTNQNSAILSFNPGCDWRVDMLENNAWTVLGQAGGCQPYAIGLEPGQSLPYSVHVRAVALGTPIRVAVGWGRNQEAVSESVSLK